MVLALRFCGCSVLLIVRRRSGALQERNDALLVSYLATITKEADALHDVSLLVWRRSLFLIDGLSRVASMFC